jgi:glutaredoxin
MQVILYSKADCRLCNEVKAFLTLLAEEISFEWVERDISDNPLLYERFRYLIPVLEIANGPFLYPPHNPYAIRTALLQAKQPDR